MIFQQEDFGKTITAELSECIKEYTNRLDIADVNRETGISTSSINYILLRTNSLTRDNSRGIIAMMKRAQQNCKKRIISDIQAEKMLDSMLTNGVKNVEVIDQETVE